MRKEPPANLLGVNECSGSGETTLDPRDRKGDFRS